MVSLRTRTYQNIDACDVIERASEVTLERQERAVRLHNPPVAPGTELRPSGLPGSRLVCAEFSQLIAVLFLVFLER